MSIEMKTRTTATAKCADGSDHEWEIARWRGTRVRHRCIKCGHMDPWEKSGPKNGEMTPAPINITTGGAVKTDGAPIFEELQAQFWNGSTVAELKQLAKKRGITGYSKMKRDDLLAVLS